MGTFSDSDVLILDRDLPVMTGNGVCSRLNERTDPPRILMLTAAGDIMDKVYGLEQLGTDDYLAKPFDFAELVARVRALSRRAPKPPPVVLHLGGIVLDRARHEVRVGTKTELTPKEFAVLEMLMKARGDAVTRRELVRAVCDENLNPPHQRGPCHRQRLRAKLGNPDAITTDTGEGYRLCG